MADPLIQAEMLMTRGRFADARKLLDEQAAHESGEQKRDNQVQFLLGLLDMQDKDYDGAIAHFHRVLVSEPNQVRVRLELGRAYFLKNDYANAQRQFLYARAGKLPKAVLTNIDRFLSAIRQKKTFTWTLTFAVVPDSNLNAGPATDTVSLYGLPFQLSPDARANSGVGLSADLGAEWSPRIGERTKWRLGAGLHRVQYRQTEFDDMTLSVYTGPHLTLKRWDINLLGNVARRWFGDRPYSISYGPSADVTYYLNQRLGLGLAASLSQVNYHLNPLQNGLNASVSGSFFLASSPSSFIRGGVTIGRQEARFPGYAYESRQVGLSYTRELPGGITVGLAPSVTFLNYDAALAAFTAPRRDRQYAAQVSVLDRKIVWFGLTPRIAYTVIRNNSNIALYTFKRNRFEIGLTSTF